MADEKWIAGLAGDMPAHEAAQLALGAAAWRGARSAAGGGLPCRRRHRARASTARRHAAAPPPPCASSPLVCPSGCTGRPARPCAPAPLRRRGPRLGRVPGDAAGTPRSRSPAGTKTRPRFPARLRPRPAHAIAQDHLRQAFGADGDKFTLRIQQVGQALAASDSPETLRDLAHPILTQLLRELEAAARGDLAPLRGPPPGPHPRQATSLRHGNLRELLRAGFRNAITPPSSRCRKSSAWPTTATPPASASRPASAPPAHPAQAMAALSGRHRIAAALSRTPLAAAGARNSRRGGGTGSNRARRRHSRI